MKKIFIIISAIFCIFGISGQASADSADPKFKLPDYVFQIPIGKLSKLVPVDCSSGTCEVPFISQYVNAVYEYSLTIAGVLGVLMLMAAGLLWMVSGGDSGKITKAKQMISGSILGLLLLVGLVTFLSFINPDLTKQKSIVLTNIERMEMEVDSDVTIVGGAGENPYQAGCVAAKNKDLSVCKAYGQTAPAGLVTTSNGKKLSNSSYVKFKAAMDCVKNKNNGKDIFYINGGWRSALGQIQAKEDWTKKGKPQNAATPCCSNHGIGSAMDLSRIDGKMSWDYNQKSGLTACMNAQGLYAKLSAEPWHWSPSGK